MGTFLGVPIIRTIVYLGLYWVPLILGNYHFFWLVSSLSRFFVVLFAERIIGSMACLLFKLGRLKSND